MNPWGQFTWTYEGGDLPPNVQENNSITLLSLKSKDFGSYVCEAENTIGFTNFRLAFTLEVNLLGPPGKPSNLTVEAITSVSVTLGWTCGHNGGDDNIWFQVEIKMAGGKFELYNSAIEATCDERSRIDPDFRVDGLESSTNYAFRVSALNRFINIEQAPYTTIQQATASKFDFPPTRYQIIYNGLDNNIIYNQH